MKFLLFGFGTGVTGYAFIGLIGAIVEQSPDNLASLLVLFLIGGISLFIGIKS